ncbi:sodium:solute symporter family transporter [Myroides odoratus]
MSRLAVLLIAGIALLLAQDEHNSILGLVARAWAGFGAAFGPLLLFTLFWKKTTGWAALTGILVGGLTVVFWPMFQKDVLGGIIFGFREPLYEIIPGFLLSACSIFLVSIVGSVPAVIQETFQQAQTKYQQEK